MLSGTACGLLLLPGSLAVTPAIDVRLRLALLTLEAFPLLVALLPYTKHSLISYRRLRSTFTPAALALSRECARQQHFPAVWSPKAANHLAPRRFAVCRRAASVAAITAWSFWCFATMLNSLKIVRYEIKSLLSFQLSAEHVRIVSASASP